MSLKWRKRKRGRGNSVSRSNNIQMQHAAPPAPPAGPKHTSFLRILPRNKHKTVALPDNVGVLLGGKSRNGNMVREEDMCPREQT